MTAEDPKRSCRLSRVESIADEGGPSNGSASWTASSPNRLPKVMPISVIPRCSISVNALTSRIRATASNITVSPVASGRVCDLVAREKSS